MELARLELSQREGQSVEMAQAQLDAANLALANLRLRLPTPNCGRIGRRGRWRAAKSSGRSRNSAIGDHPRVQDAAGRTRGRDRQPSIDRRRERLRSTSDEAAGSGHETERKIQAEASNIVAALDNEVVSTRQQLEQLAQQVRELEVRTIELSRGELRINQLEREAEANQAIYQSFLTRLNETAEQASLQTSDAHFLTRAEPPQRVGWRPPARASSCSAPSAVSPSAPASSSCSSA